MYLTSKKVQDALTGAGIKSTDLSAALSQLVSDSAKRTHLTVNPRYGKWDSTQGNIVDADLASGAVTKK